MKNKEKICTCMCHIKGMSMMHIMACCTYTYQKYINKDFTIDYVEYKKIKKEKNG